MRQADPLQRRARGGAQMADLAGIAPEMEGVAVMGLRRQRDIVERGEIRQQRGDLERARQSERAAAIGRHMGDVLTRKADGAGVRQQLSGQLADQRGLAGAVRSDDGVHLSAGNIERDVVGRYDAAEPPDQIFDPKQGISHGAASPKRP